MKGGLVGYLRCKKQRFEFHFAQKVQMHLKASSIVLHSLCVQREKIGVHLFFLEIIEIVLQIVFTYQLIFRGLKST